MSYSSTNILVPARETHAAFYGNFRGVDFSSDHTQVNEHRLAYLVNMYKDYQSAQGQALETIPGFRRRIEGLDGKVLGIHPFTSREKKTVILIHAGEKLYCWEDAPTDENVEQEYQVQFEDMNVRKSVSFVMNNRLYIIDGKNYIYYDGKGVKRVEDEAYIPTTHINISSGDRGDGSEYEQRNIFQPQFRNTFVGDGAERQEFAVTESGATIIEVSVDGQKLEANKDYTVDEDRVQFTSYTPASNSEVCITAETRSSMFGPSVDGKDVIKGCTIACVFDNRVFLSGNPNYPNHIFWCMLNSTGNPDPSYFGILNYQQDGTGNAPITGMIPVSDALMVLKSDTQQDGSVYYHTPQISDNDIYSKTYPSQRGLSGIGCLGACANFLDDPVFVSRLGLEAVGQLSVRYERAIEHRSSLIDAKLVNLGEEALKNAVLEEWNGYLLLLADGKIFMADSRQRYTHEIGVMQYEWYYLEDIGIFEGQTEKTGVDGESLGQGFDGGDFKKATVIKAIGSNIFFGTENGVLCSFNFDKRNNFGEIPISDYSFDGRTIFCGAATKMDCCGTPHLSKNTVKKSTVIKTKAMASSALKIMVRTNNKPYEQIARINTKKLNFNDVNFEDFTFVADDETIFSINEKAKKWVEKQYYIFSDEYCKPFSLFYVSHQYMIVGKIKN